METMAKMTAGPFSQNCRLRMDIFRGFFITVLILLACLDHSNAAHEYDWFGGILGDHHGSSKDRIHDGLTHLKDGVMSGTKKIFGGIHEIAEKSWHGTTHVLGGIFGGLQEMVGMKPKTTTDRVMDKVKDHGDRLLGRTQDQMHDTLDGGRDVINGVHKGMQELSRRLSGNWGHSNYW